MYGVVATFLGGVVAKVLFVRDVGIAVAVSGAGLVAMPVWHSSCGRAGGAAGVKVHGQVLVLTDLVVLLLVLLLVLVIASPQRDSNPCSHLERVES